MLIQHIDGTIHYGLSLRNSKSIFATLCGKVPDVNRGTRYTIYNGLIPKKVDCENCKKIIKEINQYDNNV